jgi:hypothetical protein
MTYLPKLGDTVYTHRDPDRRPAVIEAITRNSYESSEDRYHLAYGDSTALIPVRGDQISPI